MMSFAEEKVQELSPEIDGYVLKQTLDAVNDDHDVEQIFEGILGLSDSKADHDPQSTFDTMGRKKLSGILEGFWKRALSSSVGSDAVRERRIVTCVKVINAVRLSSEDLGGLLQSVEIGHSLKSLNTGSLEPLAQILVSGIISNVQERDDRWFALAMDQLGVPRDVIRTHVAHGDSMLLANLITIIRQLFHTLLQGDLDLMMPDPFRLLLSATKLDIQDTLPELQRDFCALWNEIILQGRNGGPHVGLLNEILVEIQHLYIALHYIDGTPTDFFASTTGHDDIRHLASYPSCNVADHHSNMFSHTHEVASCLTDRAGHAFTTTPPVPEIVLATAALHVPSIPSRDPDRSSGGPSSGDDPDVPQHIALPVTTPNCAPSESRDLGSLSSAQTDTHSQTNSSRTAAISSPDTSTGMGTFVTHDDNPDLRRTPHTGLIHEPQPRMATATLQPPNPASSENPT
ncbi:hypothetical protein BC826DRAFT_1047893 [Russula brevipes]|nr:hypothetical protein BC826DRAFT_1047893 [Russula brevipes]